MDHYDCPSKLRNLDQTHLEHLEIYIYNLCGKGQVTTIGQI